MLFDAAEAIRLAAVLLAPIMPASSREILRRVGASSDGLNFDRDGRWRHDGERVMTQDGPLWPRKEPTTRDRRNQTPPPAAPPASPHRLPLRRRARTGRSAPAAAPAAPVAERISIDDFMKVELRTAKVLTAEKVEKSKKLLKLSVDVGTEHADAGRRHRRGLRARSARRQDRRHRLQPEAGEADGDRVERDGARRQPRRRQADGRLVRESRPTPGTRVR